MKMKKRLSLLLAVAMVISLFAAVPVFAANSKSVADNQGIAIDKTAADNGDGTFTVTLEAFATGSKVVTDITEDIPTDIVLVLDQSGSMKENMNSVTTYSFSSYGSRTNSQNYSARHNGGSSNLWYQLPDGSYVSVSVTRARTYVYSEVSSYRNSSLYSNRSSLYALVGGTYKLVSVARTSSGNWWNRVYNYTYSVDGVTIGTGNGESSNWTSVDGTTDDGKLYIRQENDYEYTYSYTVDGVTTQIGDKSLGANTAFSETFFRRNSQTTTVSRMQALVNALNTFVTAVNTKAAGEDGDISTTEDNVNHRIAVVGFASGSNWNGTNYRYGNTEVFVGPNQYTYGTSARGVYDEAFQSMDTTAGRNNVAASINALTADGGTLIQYGMEMAHGILDANPLNDGEKRNRVVVVFTDGQPGWSGYDSSVANSAINEGASIKDMGATIYTVGVFSGADATTAGSDSSNASTTAKSNWFMQQLSSNNGTVQNPSYYLSAADAETLNSIFKQISDQIESGGSSTTLGASTEIRDIIAPSFTLPAGTTADDISIVSYPCVGVTKNNNGTSTYDFSTEPNNAAVGAYAVVNGDNVDVSGFDFAANYCGVNVAADHSETIVGSKLVISFVVTPKDGFIGGNDVPTNTHAGVYEDAESTVPVMVFPVPTVNVPIVEPDFLVNDKTIYEGGSTAVSGLYTLPEITDADAWKYAYVTVSNLLDGVTGETVSPADCTDYDVTVTYAPITDGTDSVGAPNAMEGVSAAKTAVVHVLKPDVIASVNDVLRFYGESYTLGDGVSEYINVEWNDKNGHTSIPDAEGTAPFTGDDLTLSYSSASGSSFTVPKADTDVAVSVMKGDEKLDALIATICEIPGENCAEVDTDGIYTVHYATGSLTLTKAGGNDGESYVFHIYKDGRKYTELTIVGNASKTIYELPAGTYTVREDTGWSWRFQTFSFDKESVTISAETPNVSITCTNTQTNDNWLNYFTDVITNIFGEEKK